MKSLTCKTQHRGDAPKLAILKRIMRLVEVQCAHRKHCYPETHLGDIPLLGSHSSEIWSRARMPYFSPLALHKDAWEHAKNCSRSGLNECQSANWCTVLKLILIDMADGTLSLESLDIHCMSASSGNNILCRQESQPEFCLAR